ncbi:hypothetical protein B0H17DRAFT_949076, partial [Mycena rosella]
SMAEFCLINIDKREVVDPSDQATDYGWKMRVSEAIMNGMPLDIVWLFAVPADAQSAPTPPAAQAHRDALLIVDEYFGTAADYLPAEVIAEYATAAPTDEVLAFALENFKHVSLPGYEHKGEADKLFPVDHVWAARNLTKKWYARSDLLVEAKYRRGPDVSGGVGLGELIWVEIGGAMSTEVEGGVGDRFDVQPLSTVENPEGGTQWADASAKAKHCLATFEQDFDVDQFRDH